MIFVDTTDKPNSEQTMMLKVNQWKTDAAIAAAKAQQMGVDAQLIRYPSGLVMSRFAATGDSLGTRYEVPPEIWNAIKENGGEIPA